MAGFTVRDAIRADCAEVCRLIQELADFEKMPDGPKINEKDLERDGFDLERPLFHCFVVDHPSDPSKLIGYAFYYYTYATWTGKRMYLEDIFVSEPFRGKGVGNMLFQKVAQKGVETNCTDMDFVVLGWNPAQDFYKSRGACDKTEAEGWHLFRLSPDSLKSVARNGK